MTLTLLVFAPTRRAATETFVRANLEGLPFRTVAYFGDERPLASPDRLAYGLAILASKLLTRLRLLRLASLPGSLVAWWLIRRHRPDVLLAEFGFHAVRVMEAAAWSGVPLVVHFRGSDASAHGRLGLLAGRYRRLMALVAGVIVKSEPMRRTLLELGAPPQRLLVSPSGADARLFHGADPAAAPPCFLAVGRFVAKKGPLETLQAFARMRELLPPEQREAARLVMVGDGPLLEPARQRVRQWGLEAVVQLPGLADRGRVAALMRAARAFVQHSRVAPDGDSEGSPVAVMEAQLCGLPVVATRHAGIPEVVQEGVSGFLVAEGDTEAMAQAMARLVCDPQLAARLGQAGQARVAACFTVEHHLRAVSALIEAVAVKAEAATLDNVRP
jgi:glycosyltransferase involved in cell wall biosynthesis